ncbi:F-box protein [Trifolium pratense]|uniref:F-box protein n=1 Tax=Trifolium pratense TaxID=57577 RepID=A0A2K3LGW0_TRIPR|nr:F-box protein [Trifolium pratense]
MAADWSELPTDLLNLISECIDNEIDLIRFRSICSTWRSSSIPNHHTNILPFKFPLLKYVRSSDSVSDDDVSDSIDDYEFSDSININDTKFPFSYLSKRSIFLIKPQQQQQDQTLILRPWLVRITQNSTGKTKIFQPDTVFDSLFPSFHYSNMLDFNELSVLHIGTNFFIDNDDFTFPDQCYDYLNPDTVLAVTCHGKKPLVLAALCFVTHRPLLFRGLDEIWTPISLSTFYGDICVFKGRIYAVNLFGRTVVVGPESSVQLVAQPIVSGVTQKLLVESEGKLLLVNMCESYPDFFGIDLFELDEKENKWVRLMDFDEKKNEWVKLKDIGDRVLFLASGCSFSAYASELGLPKGNCVVFFDDSVVCCGNLRRGNCVFHLDQDRLSPASEYPEYLNMFQPPEWILKS